MLSKSLSGGEESTRGGSCFGDEIIGGINRESGRLQVYKVHLNGWGKCKGAFYCE